MSILSTFQRLNFHVIFQIALLTFNTFFENLWFGLMLTISECTVIYCESRNQMLYIYVSDPNFN